MAVLFAEYAHVDVSHTLVAGTDRQTPWQMPMELHARMMSRVRAPPSQPGSPERCSSVGRAPPQRFIKPLLPRPEITGECQRNYIAPKRDHPRVQLPSCDTPRRKTISAEMGAGPRNVSFPLSPDLKFPANAGGTTFMDWSRVRAPPPQPAQPERCSSVGRAVPLRFTHPLLPDPKQTWRMPWWNYTTNVEVVGSNPTPVTMTG